MNVVSSSSRMKTWWVFRPLILPSSSLLSCESGIWVQPDDGVDTATAGLCVAVDVPWPLRCLQGSWGQRSPWKHRHLTPCPKSSLLFLGTQTLRCHCCCSTRLKENKNLKWTITLNTWRLTRYFIGLRILLQYILTISTGSWLQPADARSSHLKNLWTKPGQHPCTLNPVEHTNYMYLFIYHVCMLGMKRVIIYIED